MSDVSATNSNIQEEPKLKKCTKCGLKKDISEFSNKKSNKDGMQHICKSCQKEYYEKWITAIRKEREIKEQLKKDKKTKFCNKCKQEKDKTEFNRNKREKDGLNWWCKSCQKEYIKPILELQRKETLIKEKIKSEKTTKICRKCKKEKDKTEFQNRLTIDGFDYICKSCHKEYYEAHREKHLLKSYKRTDKKKGFVCDLDEEWLKENITSKPCIYCGDTEKIGCDRKNNSIGHTKENCVPCDGECNRIRSNGYSFEEMLILGKTIRKIKQARKLKKSKKGKKSA